MTEREIEANEARRIVRESMRPQEVGVIQYLDQGALTANIARALADRNARLARLTEAARALDAKLDAMEVPLNAVCTIAQMHSVPYAGPKWTEERQALKAALADAGAGKERGDG